MHTNDTSSFLLYATMPILLESSERRIGNNMERDENAKMGLAIDDIIDTVHVFPTMSEAIKLVAQSSRKDISKLSCCVE